MKTTKGVEIGEIDSVEIPLHLRQLHEKSKVPERYPLHLFFEFVAGKAGDSQLYYQPEVAFRTEHLVSDVREQGIASLDHLTTGNVTCILGIGGLDLNCMPENPDGILGVPVSFPVVTPSQKFNFYVRYSGKVPRGIKAGETFKVGITLVGTALDSY